ncbi:hypothetical protein Prudu_016858 [Prunus dulcis]|uniref:Uncharacterized protein n=1 Tax=Prunus dulcis TaxID=3755 RepID=A0A4Y1RNF8_PRUDU|nr:hypothetical protein Prudu_016858 [Prunus dulcis]
MYGHLMKFFDAIQPFLPLTEINFSLHLADSTSQTPPCSSLVNPTGSQLKDEEAVNLMQENKKLRAKCLEYEKKGEELNLKVTRLRSEIKELNDEYSRMMSELESLETVKEESENIKMFSTLITSS